MPFLFAISGAVLLGFAGVLVGDPDSAWVVSVMIFGGVLFLFAAISFMIYDLFWQTAENLIKLHNSLAKKLQVAPAVNTRKESQDEQAEPEREPT